MKVKTNRTNSEPDYRLELTTKEVRNFVFPRFKCFTRNFKIVPWAYKGGLKLHYKKDKDGTVTVGFEEPGYGVAERYYTMDELEVKMMPF